MNYEQDEELTQILEGAEVGEILDALLDKLPELLAVVRSSTTEPCNAIGLATLEGSNRELCLGRALARSPLLYFHPLID